MALALTILLWLGAILWIIFLLQLAVNWVLVPALCRKTTNPPGRWPSVSIVVPARNEERRIREAVSSFCRQDYDDFEVVVVDDGSTDATPQILRALQSAYPNLKVVAGQEPPEGWLGKPNALETGRTHARGQWLLFVDADVEYAPTLLRRAVAYALEQDAAMLFLLPGLTTASVIEAVIMSSLCLVPFAVVPTFLVSRTPGALFAVGGGVFNLVRRDALETCGAFACLKDAVIDDIGLGYAIKRAGFKQAVGLSGPLIRVRMYDGAWATIEGFTKNAYSAMGRRWWAVPAVLATGTVISLLPYYGFFAALVAGSISVPATISLACMHVTLAALAILFRQPWQIIFLNPLRELCWWLIMFRSVARHHRHGVVWRGRRYDLTKN